MRVPIEVLFAVCIFPIILGSPLGFKNPNEDTADLESDHIRANLPPKGRVTPSDPNSYSLIYRKPPKDWEKDNRYKNRRTTTNKSEAVGVTEIYMPKSRYLSRGYKPVYIYYVTDPPAGKESSTQAPADDFENAENKESSSKLHKEDETKSRTPLEDTFEDELNEKSDYADSEESEYEYEDDSEYADQPEDEYPNTDSSALSATHEVQHPGHDNRVCAHHGANQNQGFPGHYPKPGYPRQYPNQDYQGQNYNARSRGYPTNTGYQGYYPSTGNQGHYPYGYQGPHYGYQGPPIDNNQGPYPYRGYQGPHPYRGYQGPHLDNNQGPNRGYQGPHLDNNQGPYRGYQGPHLDNNQGPNRGYQGSHLDNNQGPYRGYQGPHLDNNQGPYRGYQGPHPHRGYQGPHLDDYQGPHPDHRGHHVNSLNQNVDPNCDHGNTNLGRDGNKPESVVESGLNDVDSGHEYDNFSGENSEYSGAEYYDDDEEEDSEYDEDESEDSSDKPEIPLQSDITFESNEVSNGSEKIHGNDIGGKTDDLLNSDYLNDQSSDPESNIPNESNSGTESGDKSVEGDGKMIHKCIKSIQSDENLSKNLTDTTISSDCVSETIKNVEGNKSGRLLDIFTRTNISVECTTPRNESGQCKSFSECPIGNIMNNYNLFLQYMCLRGVFVGVCCPDNPVVEISDSDDDNTTESSLDIQQPPEGCGLTQKTRIVGGTISAPHEWTWMVALMRRNRFFCGGVIINNWYVLTAAHCVLGVNVKDLKVRLGEYNFMERTDQQHDINVAEIKRHAMFVTATFQHDIALLKLKRRVEYSKFIGSICLPETNARSYSDDKATVVGWGTVSFGGAASPILRQVTVPVWDNEDCDRTYFLERIDESFLCAGNTENGEDACQGDSGGPLMTLNSDNRWEVIGVVSWGRRCGDPTYPGVYTRVTSYIDWIAAHAK